MNFSYTVYVYFWSVLLQLGWAAPECLAPPKPIIGCTPGPETSQCNAQVFSSFCCFRTWVWKSALCDITEVTEVSSKTVWTV